MISPIFIEEAAEAIVRDVDVKFVWGDPFEHVLTPGVWQTLESILETRFQSHGLNQVQRDVAHCKFHLVNYQDARPGAVSPVSHAKFYMLDQGFYVGSQNLYPSGFMGRIFSPELKEFGFFVDAAPGVNEDLSDEVVSRVVAPVWANSRTAPQQSNWANCAALAHPTRLAGTANTPFGTYTCGSNFNLTLDFHDVEHDEVARVTGQTTCSSAGFTVQVQVQGRINTERVFTGTISGNLPGLAADTAPLIGVFQHGALDAAFTGLEPIQGVPYSGTVSTRMP
ncbi:hypothetical protein ACLEPN_08500 [Myxococcus sp. 1LA]